MKIDTNNLIDMGQAADILGVTRQRISQMIHEGKIKLPINLSGKFFFQRQKIEALKKPE